jgi:hypothetical protein
VLVLTSRRAGANGPAFVLGWLVRLGTVGAIVLTLAGPGPPAGRPSLSDRAWIVDSRPCRRGLLMDLDGQAVIRRRPAAQRAGSKTGGAHA